MKTYILILLTATFLFASCRASKHPGVTYVVKPAMTETSSDTWYRYWYDQFDAYKGVVVEPDGSYPNEAIQSYQRAKQEYERKQGKATLGNGLIVGTLTAGASIVLGLALSGY